MIQATIENSALATKIFIFPPLFFFFQFFKTLERTLSSSVDSHDSFKRNKVSNRKRKTFSSCIWHPRTDCHTTFKQKKQRRSGQAPGRTCTSLSHNDWKRSHGVYSPNHLVNHMCKCVWFFLFVSLTALLDSVSAPISNKSCTIAVWPLNEANMSAVMLYYTKIEGKKGHTIVAKKERTRGVKKRR